MKKMFYFVVVTVISFAFSIQSWASDLSQWSYYDGEVKTLYVDHKWYQLSSRMNECGGQIRVNYDIQVIRGYNYKIEIRGSRCNQVRVGFKSWSNHRFETISAVTKTHLLEFNHMQQEGPNLGYSGFVYVPVFGKETFNDKIRLVLFTNQRDDSLAYAFEKVLIVLE